MGEKAKMETRIVKAKNRRMMQVTGRSLRDWMEDGSEEQCQISNVDCEMEEQKII